MDRYRAAGIEVEPRRIPARIHRTVDESFEAGALELGFPAARAGDFQGRSEFPIGGQYHARLHWNLARVVARRVEDERVPFEEQDVAGNLYRADFGTGGRQIVEVDVERLHSGGWMHAKRVDIDGIARPGHRRTVRGHPDARQPVNGALRRMRAG